MSSISLPKSQNIETDIAVLQTRVNNVDSKIVELKADIKDVHDALDTYSKNNMDMMRDMQHSSSSAHKALSEKISTLEKWRWMLMGAGIVIGSLGYDTIAKLLK